MIGDRGASGISPRPSFSAASDRPSTGAAIRRPRMDARARAPKSSARPPAPVSRSDLVSGASATVAGIASAIVQPLKSERWCAVTTVVPSRDVPDPVAS